MIWFFCPVELYCSKNGINHQWNVIGINHIVWWSECPSFWVIAFRTLRFSAFSWMASESWQKLLETLFLKGGLNVLTAARDQGYWHSRSCSVLYVCMYARKQRATTCRSMPISAWLEPCLNLRRFSWFLNPIRNNKAYRHCGRVLSEDHIIGISSVVPWAEVAQGCAQIWYEQEFWRIANVTNLFTPSCNMWGNAKS